MMITREKPPGLSAGWSRAWVCQAITVFSPHLPKDLPDEVKNMPAMMAAPSKFGHALAVRHTPSAAAFARRATLIHKPSSGL